MNDSESLVRQLKIDLITGQANPIIEWFNKLWSELVVIEINIYGDGEELVYYKPGIERWIFVWNKDSNRFWCHYELFWNLLESRFHITLEHKSIVTTILVENSLNQTIANPCSVRFKQPYIIDDALRNALKNNE